MDSTRAISEGTGEKDTKKALEFRRKEVGIGIDNTILFSGDSFFQMGTSKY